MTLARISVVLNLAVPSKCLNVNEYTQPHRAAYCYSPSRLTHVCGCNRFSCSVPALCCTNCPLSDTLWLLSFPFSPGPLCQGKSNLSECAGGNVLKLSRWLDWFLSQNLLHLDTSARNLWLEKTEVHHTNWNIVFHIPLGWWKRTRAHMHTNAQRTVGVLQCST